MDILGLVDLPNWLLILLLIVLAWYIHGTWTFGAFKGSGLSGPKPYVSIGTLGPGFTKGFHALDVDILKKYGETFAMFDGRLPSVYTSDEDIIKAVTVKEFQHFVNHRVAIDSGEPFNLLLTALQDDHWKRIRNLLSPTFSTGKIKRMAFQVNRTSKLFVDNLEEYAKNKTTFDVKAYTGAFTMDTIASTAFGLDINSQADLDNQFVKMAKKLFNFSTRSPIMILFVLFPFLAEKLGKLGISFLPKDVFKFFTNVVERALEERKKDSGMDSDWQSNQIPKLEMYAKTHRPQRGRRPRNNRSLIDTGTKQPDFLQLMINAHEEEEAENDVTDPAINDGSISDKAIKKSLSHKELLANSFLFFLAGFETTSMAMTYLIYNLTVYPDVQAKLYQEIMDKVGDKENVEYSVLNEMPYLDHCMSESLRLYPPAIRTDRECKKDITIKGIHIKKGWAVVFPIYAMQRSPEYWEDPDDFKPERFAEMNEHNYHYMPFGAGPRNCIGMRLAQMEIKVAVIKLLQRYKLVKTEETQFPLKLSVSKVMNPEKPIKIGVVSRS